ncbi:MFS transporter [Rhodococcus sp. NPDC058521]|uniref:MFS transporter n=1 Tax=Rhodococcus sp. NPDC058521 TaxID=3346536 RepID=UPI00365CC15E
MRDGAETEQQPDTGAANRRWTTFVAALACFLMTLDGTVINVALPSIQSDLHTSLTGLQWVVNAYILAFASLLLTVGSLSDHVSRKKVFLTGTVAFTATSALCVFSQSEAMLVTSRALQGASAALVFGTCLALIADAHAGADPELRRKAVGGAMAAGAAAAALGPLIGGGLVELGAWQWIFAINIPIGIVLALATAVKVPNSTPAATTGRTDWAGAVMVVVPLFGLNYGLLTGADSGWSQPDVVAALTIAVIAAVIFIRHERRLGTDALLDLSLFRIPTFTAAIVLGLTVRFLSFALFPFLILWLAGAHGLSAFQIGLVMTAMAVPLMVTAAASAPLATVIGVGKTMAVSMVITAVGLFLGLLIGDDAEWSAMMPSLVVVGIGCGLAMPHLMNLATDVAPPNKVGMATGAANTAFPLGTAAGIAMFGAVISGWVRAKIDEAGLGLPTEQTHSFADAVLAGMLRYPSELQTELATSAFTGGLRLIFVVAGCGALVAAVVSALLIRESDRRDDATEPAREPSTP